MTPEERQKQTALTISIVLDLQVDLEQRGDDAVRFVEESMHLTPNEAHLVKAGAILGARSIMKTVREMSGRE